ncbi:O-fucosyltransferase 27-like [Populus alba x Populus x berolinensis]|uniref:O-fucosyltransferase family protein n=1 Tax=Populus alba x Populus x berolinensis TaxID=444605 RepID=A0AAD6R329_9ROSI|nr:O-fucosyltransferase 27-like [Populus alba x Populus x berolinensis]
MKGERKTMIKSKMKWVGLVGLVLSAFSLFVHFLLARFTEEGVTDYQSSVTIFSWRPVFENPDFAKNSPSYRRLWGPVRRLESLHPDANPRGYYTDPRSESSGYVFVRIQGGFHEIRNSICDVVVISRLLNATLVIPEIQSTTRSKGISSQFKSFAYLYNEDNFMAALVKDVKVVKTLPQNLKDARRLKKIPSFRVPNSASPYFYLHHVLPVLIKHVVVELVVSDGGCLQAILPPQLEEYQRLRCRVAFHALRFRQEVQELATKMLQRLRAPGQPFIAFDPGLTRDALAYYGCAELFQDVHSELIQHKRAWMKKRGIVKGKLSVNSAEQRLNGSCPLMPEEVGILLRAYGYPWDTILYVSGGEVFGGQRTLTPLHAMFENIVDRTSLSAAWELNRIYGREVNLVDTKLRAPPSVVQEKKHEIWKNEGPRPRPLPPPPARPKYPYNIEGWWGWVAESDNEPESTVMELRTNAHKLLWEAIDYLICVEADVFIPGFDRDGKGHPNFASLVMGHRLYQAAASKTFQPNRREVVKLLEENREHLYQANHTWLTSTRSHLRRSLIDGVIRASTKSKPLSFLSHPVPECSCLRYDLTKKSLHVSSPSTQAPVEAALGVMHHCPKWMDSGIKTKSKDKEIEEDPDEDISSSSGLFFRNSGGNHESGGGELIKEESQLDDQEELEGAD